MYRLIKIWELTEELTGGPGKLLPIDVPDAGSPTGWTTKYIQAENLKQVQDLRKTLAVGNNTGGNDVRVTEGDLLAFEKGVYTATLEPQTMTNDVRLFLPNEDGTLAINYDSGWKSLPLWNGSYGLPDTGNTAYRPSIRIVNRNVYLKGKLIIAMTTTAGGSTLDTNGINYASNFYSDVYAGTGGYTINPTGREALRTPVILPSTLWPDINANLLPGGSVMGRTVNIAGRIRLHSFIPAFFMTTGGYLQFNTNNTDDRNGDTGASWDRTHHARIITDRFENGDSIFEYDNFYNSFNGPFSVDKRTVSNHGSNYSWDHDGNLPQDLGGHEINVNGSYTLSTALSLDQIKTAFDAL